MNNQENRIEKRFQAVTKSHTFRNICNTFELENKSVLDIGCSYGEFLTHFGKGSAGITIASEEVRYAQEHNLNVIEGDIENKVLVSSIQEKFDVIFANNIFEHLRSPHSFLIEIKALLKKDGILILGVPCIPKITALLQFKKFRGSLASQHINFFTRDTLRLTVERAGWNINTVQGFRFKSSMIDHTLDTIYPHFYVIASLI